MDSKNMKFLISSIVLLILSGLGIFFIFKINSSSKTIELIATPTPIITSVPTQIPTIEITPTATSAAEISITPTATPSNKIKITPKLTPTIIITPATNLIPTTTTTPSTLNYKNENDGFSVSYNSGRKFYQDTESSGNRYTFYNSNGNLVVHVSPSGIWSWTNSDRNFSQAFIVSDQNTYRYDISTQTIVDLQSSSKNYTIQCVHNGNITIKNECENFIKSFQLL